MATDCSKIKTQKPESKRGKMETPHICRPFFGGWEDKRLKEGRVFLEVTLSCGQRLGGSTGLSSALLGQRRWAEHRVKATGGLSQWKRALQQGL